MSMHPDDLLQEMGGPSPTPSHPPTSPPVRKRFRLHPISFAIAAAFIGWVAIFPVFSQIDDSTMTLAYRMGRFLGVAVVASAIAAVAWIVGRRSNLAANVAFALLMAMPAVGLVLVDLKREHAWRVNAALNRLELAQAGTTDELRSAVDAGDLQATTRAMDQAVAHLQRAAVEAGGAEGAIAQAQAELMLELRAPLELQSKSGQALIDAGGSSPIGLTSLAKIDERIALINDYRRANDALKNTVAASPTRLRAILGDKNLSDREITSAIGGYLAGAQVPLQVQFREAGDAVCQAMVTHLTLLKEHWGEWTYDHDRNLIVSPPALNDLINATLDRVAQTMAEEEAMLAKVRTALDASKQQ